MLIIAHNVGVNLSNPRIYILGPRKNFPHSGCRSQVSVIKDLGCFTGSVLLLGHYEVCLGFISLLGGMAQKPALISSSRSFQVIIRVAQKPTLVHAYAKAALKPALVVDLNLVWYRNPYRF